MPNAPVHPNESDEMRMMKRDGQEVGLMDAGYPGYLTQEEMDIYEKFRAEVSSRDDAFQDTVFSFKAAHEEERFALCRWLRARKYNLQDTIQMVEEATICTSEPKSHNFYPTKAEALHAEPIAYSKAYPQMYYSHGKNGCPVFISKPGVLDHLALDCLTTRDGLINYHWHDQMHGFVNQLKQQHVRSSGSFKRYECICILDLKDLTSSQLSKRCLNIIKIQTAIDSLCFPETLNKMFIVNAPSFFTMTWKLLKGWVDARTAAKVSLIGTNQAKILKKLQTVIDIDQIPEEYGGNGENGFSFLERVEMEEVNRTQPLVRGQETYLMPVRGTASQSLIVKKEHDMKLTVMTRSNSGGYITIYNASDGSMVDGIPKGGIFVSHDGDAADENVPGVRLDLADHGVTLEGGCSYDFKIKSNGGSFSTDYFLLLTTESALPSPTQDENVDTSNVTPIPTKTVSAVPAESDVSTTTTTACDTSTATSTSSRPPTSHSQQRQLHPTAVLRGKSPYAIIRRGSTGGALISAQSLGVGTLPSQSESGSRPRTAVRVVFSPSPGRIKLEERSGNLTKNPTNTTTHHVNVTSADSDEMDNVPTVKRLAQAHSYSSESASVSASTATSCASASKKMDVAPSSPKYSSTTLFSCGVFSCY